MMQMEKQTEFYFGCLPALWLEISLIMTKKAVEAVGAVARGIGGSGEDRHDERPGELPDPGRA